MGVTYANVHSWYKDVVDDPFSLFGKSEQKKLSDALKKVAANDVTYSIEPLNEDFFDWWLPMYQEHISAKDNPTIFDVKEKILANSVNGKKYFSLTLLERDKRLGG